MKTCTPHGDKLLDVASPSRLDWPAKRRLVNTIRKKLVAHGMIVHPPHVAPEALNPDPSMPLRVLIADDYADTAESLAMLLSQAGIETQVATRGDEAFAHAIRWRPHICVLDIDMPGCNGRDVARRIRKHIWDERPFLIAVTGWTSAEERRRTLAAGFDYYLIKPVEPARLVRIIRQAPGMSLT
jgi:CheY-like chemotaxis protein